LKTFQDFYAQKDYVNALKTLKSQSSELPPTIYHYNLGTTLAQLGNLPEARAHFLKAQDLGNSLPELQENLKFVEGPLEIVRLEAPLSAADYFIKGAQVMKGGLLTSASLLVLIAGLFLVKQKPSPFRMLALILLVSAPVALNFWITAWPRAVVLEEQTILEGPSSIFSSSQSVVPGVLVIGEREGNWFHVRYPSRFKGWIQAKGLYEL
jgi:tetratricopeptide (TPR) repeat protein